MVLLSSQRLVVISVVRLLSISEPGCGERGQSFYINRQFHGSLLSITCDVSLWYPQWEFTEEQHFHCSYNYGRVWCGWGRTFRSHMINWQVVSMATKHL